MCNQKFTISIFKGKLGVVIVAFLLFIDLFRPSTFIIIIIIKLKAPIK